MTTLSNPVPLHNPVVIQPEVVSNSAEILEVTEDYIGKTVRALVKLSDSPSTINNIIVWGPEEYNINWTQEELENAIANYYDPTVQSSDNSSDDNSVTDNVVSGNTDTPIV